MKIKHLLKKKKHRDHISTFPYPHFVIYFYFLWHIYLSFVYEKSHTYVLNVRTVAYHKLSSILHIGMSV